MQPFQHYHKNTKELRNVKGTKIFKETIQDKSESHQVAFAISVNSEQTTEQNQRFALFLVGASLILCSQPFWIMIFQCAFCGFGKP